jgi:hypothetical protein
MKKKELVTIVTKTDSATMRGGTRWDVTHPAFVTDVLKTMAGLGVSLSVVGSVLLRPWTAGLIAGVLVALALFSSARTAGKRLGQGAGYGRILGWLLLQQFGLLLVLGWLLNVVKIHLVGFLVGAGVLPVAIVLTLVWYSIRRRHTQS